MPPAPLARTSARPTAEFDEYVLTYSRAQRWNVFLIFMGVALCMGAAMYLYGITLVIVVAVGLGLAGGGSGGLLIAAGAHAAYTRHLGLSFTHTYADPPLPSTTLRAFVPSTDGARSIRAGRFQLTQVDWQRLFEAAEAKGGRLTRDGVVKARALPRQYYHGDGWQQTIDDLRRVGLIDSDNRVTAAGWTFYETEVSPYPAATSTLRRMQERTNGRTNDTNGK